MKDVPFVVTLSGAFSDTPEGVVVQDDEDGSIRNVATTLEPFLGSSVDVLLHSLPPLPFSREMVSVKAVGTLRSPEPGKWEVAGTELPFYALVGSSGRLLLLREEGFFATEDDLEQKARELKEAMSRLQGALRG